MHTEVDVSYTNLLNVEDLINTSINFDILYNVLNMMIPVLSHSALPSFAPTHIMALISDGIR